jgi:ATP-binding cassette subfamily F protein 3
MKELYEKFRKEMIMNEKKLPPIEVRHNRNNEGKSLDLTLDNISVIVGGRVLLDSTSVKLAYGRKYGLVGRNGIGKTCFMNSLARSEFDKMPTHL